MDSNSFLYNTLLTYLTFTVSNLFNSWMQYLTTYVTNILEHHFSASVNIADILVAFDAVKEYITLHIDDVNVNRFDLCGRSLNKALLSSDTKGLLFIPADKITCKIKFEQRTIYVSYSRPAGPSDDGGGGRAVFSQTRTGSASLARIELKVYGLSPKELRKLLTRFINMCYEQHDKSDKTGVRVFTAQHDHWRHQALQSLRHMDSVIIPEQIKRSLLDDIKEFFNSADWYMKKGYKHRRGYILHGPPGCGKSSAIDAIASYFTCSINRVVLSDSTLTDGSLMDLFQTLCSRSILVIEDVDAAFIDRETKPIVKDIGTTIDRRITLSGLLNALDCIGSVENQLVIMTTNYIENIDAALIRPGRIDVRVHFDLLRPEDAMKMFHLVYADGTNEYRISELAQEFRLALEDKSIGGAVLQNYLLQRRHDPKRAINEIEQLFNNPNFELTDNVAVATTPPDVNDGNCIE